MAFGSDADQYFSRASQAGSALGEATAPYFKEQMPLSPFEQQLAQVLSGRLEPEIAARQYQASKGGMGPGLGAPPAQPTQGAQLFNQVWGGPNAPATGADNVYSNFLDERLSGVGASPTAQPERQTLHARQAAGQWSPQTSALGGAPPQQPQMQAPQGQRQITAQPQTRRDLNTLMHVSPQLMQQKQYRDWLAEQQLRNQGNLAVAEANAAGRTGAAQITGDSRVESAKVGADQRKSTADDNRDAKQGQHEDMMQYRYAALRERGAYHDKVAGAAYARIKAGQGNNQKLRAVTQAYGQAKAALSKHQIDYTKNPRIMDAESADRKAWEAEHVRLMEEQNRWGEQMAEELKNAGDDPESIDITFGTSGSESTSGNALRPPAGVPEKKAPPPASGGKKKRKLNPQTGLLE